jgi:hypothetical protein
MSVLPKNIAIHIKITRLTAKIVYMKYQGTPNSLAILKGKPNTQ